MGNKITGIVVTDNVYQCNVNSHYFLQAEDEIIKHLSVIDWSDVYELTVGPKSISKSEIIEKYEKAAQSFILHTEKGRRAANDFCI